MAPCFTVTTDKWAKSDDGLFSLAPCFSSVICRFECIPRCFVSALLRYKRRRRLISSTRCTKISMGEIPYQLIWRNRATARFCDVSSISTELLELNSDNPALHIIFIPGNPGIVSYYKDFVEALYELFEGRASITAIGHISHTRIDRENGRTFSLQDQINHKVNFIKQEFEEIEIPIIMVGHSIGAYICVEILKQLEQQIKLIVGLYPFMKLNKDSLKQRTIGAMTMFSFLCIVISSFGSLLGFVPSWITNAILRRSIGKSWSATAVEATCSDLLKYHTIRNVLYMAKTEFKKFSEDVDWAFMRRKGRQICFLFGIDDHWGPLSHFEEVARLVPEIALSVEREGHTHSFCCTEGGSLWVAHHVANLIKNQHNIEI